MPTLKFKLRLNNRRDVELFFERMLRMHLVETGNSCLLAHLKDNVSRAMNHVYLRNKVSFHYSLNKCFCHLDYKIDGEMVTFMGEKIFKNAK